MEYECSDLEKSKVVMKWGISLASHIDLTWDKPVVDGPKTAMDSARIKSQAEMSNFVEWGLSDKR